MTHTIPAAAEATARSFDLVAHLCRQAAFSHRTFGPGPRVEGVTDHIAKELIEVRNSGGALAEWVDVIILGLDGAWRSGAAPEEIVAAIEAKQTKNEARTWPDWRTAAPGKAIEHDRSADEKARRIYLSGPMSGLPEHNFPAFNAEAKRLRALGYEVVNPVDINPDPGKSWQDCLRADLVAMLACDVLVLLPGWQNSQGAQLELHIAHRVGMEILPAAEVQPAGPMCWNCDTALPVGCGGAFKADKNCLMGKVTLP